MKLQRICAGLVLALFAAAPLRADTNLDAGKAEARCRPGETGPALIIEVVGLKDRKGLIKSEVYPPDDADFLGDDNKLIREGKVFRRVEEPAPKSGAVVLCMRVPGPGVYSVMVLHDRDSNHKFGYWSDGIGFPGNPKLGWHKPAASQALVHVGAGVTRIAIVLNYLHGFGMRPEK